jgi:hypothetical protein
MTPRTQHLRRVTDDPAEPGPSDDLCRRPGCAGTAIALGCCPACLAAHRREAVAAGADGVLADALSEVLCDAAPLLYGAVSSATRQALREAALDVLLRDPGCRDLISAALAELLVGRLERDVTADHQRLRRSPVKEVVQSADPDGPVGDR